MNRTISRIEMIKLVSNEACITRKAANKAINVIFDLIHTTVGEQNTFVIPKVGTVTGKIKPVREGTDPRNGQRIVLKEKLVVQIKNYYKPKKEQD
jgi:nucleoid DNA-binding protein